MRSWTRKAVPLVVSALLAAACAAPPPKPVVQIPPGTRTVEERILYVPATWSGSVRVVRPVIVTKTATLTVKPGTRIFFDVPAPQTEAERQPWILVLGTMIAAGTPEQPISFASVQARQTDLDDMIQVQKAKEAHFRSCVFENGPWALHVHETAVDVTESTFRGNYGGVRFQGDGVTLKANRFEENTLGVRCLKAKAVLEENVFLRNVTGIFFREGVTAPVLRRNHFDNIEYDIKLGEAQTADIDASQNSWSLPKKGTLADRIYDGADAAGLGRVRIDPRWEPPKEPQAKPK